VPGRTPAHSVARRPHLPPHRAAGRRRPRTAVRVGTGWEQEATSRGPSWPLVSSSADPPMQGFPGGNRHPRPIEVWLLRSRPQVRILLGALRGKPAKRHWAPATSWSRPGRTGGELILDPGTGRVDLVGQPGELDGLEVDTEGVAELLHQRRNPGVYGEPIVDREMRLIRWSHSHRGLPAPGRRGVAKLAAYLRLRPDRPRRRPRDLGNGLVLARLRERSSARLTAAALGGTWHFRVMLGSRGGVFPRSCRIAVQGRRVAPGPGTPEGD